MADIQTVTTFLGWCTVISFSILIFSTFWIMAFRDFTKSIHSQLMSIDKDLLDSMYFQYLGNFKIAAIVFNLVPYIALRIMS